MNNRFPIFTATLAAGLIAVPLLAFGQADGTARNPPSDAVGRTVDRVTGQPTVRDGAPGNPPSTAVGRAVDRVTGQPTSPDGTGSNPPGTAVERALDRTGSAITGTPARPMAAPGAVAPLTPQMTTAAALPSSARPSERASKIIGANVYNERGESIGEVEDLLITGQPGAPIAVISVGGFLGIGARLVALPLSELRFAPQNERWTLMGATKESLQARPAFTYERRG